MHCVWQFWLRYDPATPVGANSVLQVLAIVFLTESGTLMPTALATEAMPLGSLGQNTYLAMPTADPHVTWHSSLLSKSSVVHSGFSSPAGDNLTHWAEHASVPPTKSAINFALARAFWQ